jgi:hypothetical protein
MFILLDELLINTDLLAVVKPIDDDHCSIFLAGSSPIDGGFLIDLSRDEVMSILESEEPDHLLKMANELKKEIDSSQEDETSMAGNPRRR